MAALLEEETVAYPELRRGEIIEGVVVGTDRDGILVDIGAKSEGVVPPQEMHCLQPEGSAKLNMGDKVLVFIVQPESPEGQIILSLDRARGERGWRVLQDYMDQNQAFEGYVTGSNKGGLLVNVEGVNAFVPLSQIVAGPDRGSPEATQRALTDWVGKNITLKVIELNRRRNRAILSERAAVQERRAAEKERLLLELNEGDIKTGRITSIRDFGIFVDIGGADGLVHLSEISWDRAPRTPTDLFKVGDEILVYVLKVDSESKKIALSVRRAQPERWEEIVSRYREGQIVAGQVTKLAPFGGFVKLEGPIEGLIHISELVDRRINHPKEVIEEGDIVPVKIVRIEYDRHRLGLSLRQAKEKAEEDGWSFSDSGRTLVAPADVLESFGVSSPNATPPDFSGSTDRIEAVEDVPGELVAEAVAAVDPEGAVTIEAAAEAVVEEATSADEAAEPVAEAEAPAEEAPQADTSEEPEAADEEAAVAVEEAVADEAAEPVAEAEAPADEAPSADVAEELEAVAEEAQPEAEEAPVAEAEEPQAEETAEVTAEEEAVVEDAAEGSVDEEPAAEALAEEVTDSDTDVTEASPEALNKTEES